MLPGSYMTSPSSAAAIPAAFVAGTTKCHRLQDLLPPELLYSIVTLARLTSAIPRTCSQLHSICATGHDIQFSWRNYLLLGDRASRPSPDSDDGSSQENAYSRHRSNIENTLASLLQLQLEVDDSSQPSTAFAPTRPAQPDPIFTSNYLRHLFAHTFLGPLKLVSPDSIASRPKARTASDIFPALDALLSDAPINSNWWRPVADALLLPVYFIRAGRRDLLEICLQVIANTSWTRTLTGLELPGFGWSYLSIDRRKTTLDIFSILPVTTTYPLFLATLALLEWSQPTLDLLLGFFPSLAPAAIVQLLSSNNHIIERIMVASRAPLLPANVDRIIDMYRWLQEHGALRTQTPLVKVLEGSGVSRESIERVLLQVDIPHWIRSVDDPVELVSLVTLKGAVMRCIGEYGVEEALGTLLDRGLMAPWEWGTLIPWDVAKWWPIMLKHVLSHDERREIVLHALDQSISLRSSIPQLARLAQTDYDVDLIDTVLGSGDTRHHQENLILFISLIGTPMLPNPAAALVRILAHLDTRCVSIFAMRCQELCALASFFFFMCTSLNPTAPIHELGCIRELSSARLAILILSVFVGIALGDSVMLDYMNMDKQKAAAESLVAHVCQVLKIDSPMVSARPMFDLVAPGLCSFACDMICETMTVLDSNQDGYLQEPEFVVWLISQILRLDPQFVALSVAISGRDYEMQGGIIELIPKADRDCARLSCGIVDRAEDDGLQFAQDSEVARWKRDSASVPKDALVQTIRRMVVILGANQRRAEEATWLYWQRDMLRFVDQLYYDSVE